jgi:NAD(P)-dependent dehydrogenase (short-subunit alcohol dehydrogenase family)
MSRKRRDTSALATTKARPQRNGRCAGTTRDGKPCPAQAQTGAYCYWHNPEISEAEKNAARARGHRAAKQARLPLKFTKADYTSADGARKVLEEASDLVRSGKLPVSVANAVAKLAGIALKASEVALGKRLAEVEREIKARAKHPR